MTARRALTFLLLAAPLPAQTTGGPAILTRGEAPAALVLPQVNFRPFVEFTGVYDTGLAGVAVDSSGQLGNTSSFGEGLAWGVSGAHSWSRTKVGLDYRGSLYHYNKNTYYDSTDQTLMLGVTRRVSRHTVLSLRENAGTFSRDYGLFGLSQTVPFDPGASYLPRTDFFDNRTIYLSTQADYTIQKSARLSFNIGGDGFLTRRRSTALYGVIGAAARGDIQYRLSRRSTIGIGYTFSHYEYNGVYGSSNVHGLVGTYAIRLSRFWEFSAFAGAMRAESNFLQSVRIDPVIAALIGRSTLAVTVDRIDYLPNFSGRLSRTFHRGVAYVSAARTFTPGNGLFLSSDMTSAMGGYSYTGLRRWSFSAQAAYDHSRNISNITGNYGTVSGGFSASRQITRSIHGVASFTARQYQSGEFQKYNRLIYSARIGLGWTPGDVPLRVW